MTVEHPNFVIENSILADMHRTASTAANTAEPLGPFVGAWWQAYLSEVILAAQGEVLLARATDVDRERAELAATNAQLRERVARLQRANDDLSAQVKTAQADMFYWKNRFYATPVGQAEQDRGALPVTEPSGQPGETEGLHAASAPRERIPAEVPPLRTDPVPDFTARPNPFKGRN